MTEMREAIEAKLAELHRQRGQAALAGRKFDNGLIVAEHEKLATLDDAVVEQTRQDRAEAERKHQAEVAAVRTDIADLTAASAKALADAETGLRATVSALRLYNTHAAAKRKATAHLNQLAGERNILINVMEHERLLSLLVGSQLRTITNHPSRFGVIAFPNTMPDPNKSWT